MDSGFLVVSRFHYEWLPGRCGHGRIDPVPGGVSWSLEPRRPISRRAEVSVRPGKKRYGRPTAPPCRRDLSPPMRWSPWPCLLPGDD